MGHVSSTMGPIHINMGHANNSYGPWTYIPTYFINSLCSKDILMQMSFQSFSEMHCLNSLPNFYKQLLLANSRSKPIIDKREYI